MKVVRVPGEDVTYPPRCACCLAPAEATLRVRKEDVKRFLLSIPAAAAGSAYLAHSIQRRRLTNVPYCRQCRNHVRWARLGGWLGVGLSTLVYGLFSAAGGAIVAVTISVVNRSPQSAQGEDVMALGAAVGAVVGVCFALAAIRFRADGRPPRHAREKDAAEIVGFTKESVTLRCHNNLFAAELLKANPGSSFVPR